MFARILIVAGLLAAQVCHAESTGSVPLPPTHTLTGFGTGEVYRGQTFRLPAGPAAVAWNATVYVGGTPDRGARFRLLLTDVDRSAGFHPTTVLFESPTFDVPVSVNPGTTEYTARLDGLLLQPAHEYALILDNFVVRNPTGFVSISTGIGTYADGEGFQFPNGPYFPPGSRQDHFASNNWFFAPGLDFAFRLDYTVAETPQAQAAIPALTHSGLVLLTILLGAAGALATMVKNR